MARIAVAGASGLVGRAVVAALDAAGHESVPMSRSSGVDIESGAGLDAALAGVQAVIDVLNTPQLDPAGAVAFFETTSAKLLAAEQRAGVGHHVLLSIVNVDTVEGTGHYAGKRGQERVVESGAVPWTILRATQFYDFAAMVAGWLTQNGTATVPPLLVQPVAVADVADVLVELATSAPQGRAADLAGPETHDLVDLARRTLTARGDARRVRAGWDGPFGPDMGGIALLAGPDARIGPTSADAWLEHEATAASARPDAVARAYFTAWLARDFDRLRAILADDVTFRGPLGQADDADECLGGLQGMAQMITDIRVLKIFANGPDVLTWFDLYTQNAPPTATANWMHVEDGKIARIRVTFDPRGLTG